MPVNFYIEKRLDKYNEAPIRIVWYFGGDRYQTTMGINIPPSAWDKETRRVTPGEFNHKKTLTSVINGYLDAVEKAVYWVENRARYRESRLTKRIVKTVIGDVLSAGGEYPFEKESHWNRLITERGQSRERIFVDIENRRYRLVGLGKDTETQREVVIYQALYGSNEIWVRPYELFFGQVTLPNGEIADSFREE